jgi:hypothetical protein
MSVRKFALVTVAPVTPWMQRNAIAFGIEDHRTIAMPSDLLFCFEHFSAVGTRFFDRVIEPTFHGSESIMSGNFRSTRFSRIVRRAALAKKHPCYGETRR